MSSLVTLSGASSQQLNCDCLRPLRFHSLPAVNLSHTIRSISSVYVMRAPAGFSASPRRSRVQLSKNIRVSDHITRRVQLHVGQSQCCDYPIPPPLRRSQPNKNYLILIVVDDFGQSRFQFNLLRRVQVALEHRKLQVVAKIATGLEHLPEPFVISNIVANQISRAHGILSLCCSFVKMRFG